MTDRTPDAVPTTTVRAIPGFVVVTSRRPGRLPTIDTLTPQQAREIAWALLDAANAPVRLCETLSALMASVMPPRSERL